MVIHKIGTQNEGFTFTKCGIALHIYGGKAVSKWDCVDCKSCLKGMNHRKKPRKEECVCGEIMINMNGTWVCESEVDHEC